MSSMIDHAVSALQSAIQNAGNALVAGDMSAFDGAFESIREHRVVQAMSASMSSSSDAFGEMVEQVGREVPFVRDFLGGSILMGVGAAMLWDTAGLVGALGLSATLGTAIVTIVALCVIAYGFSRAAPSLFQRAVERLKGVASDKLSLS